jgi:hypothetical protein
MLQMCCLSWSLFAFILSIVLTLSFSFCTLGAGSDVDSVVSSFGGRDWLAVDGGCGLMSSTLGIGMFSWIAKGGSDMLARPVGILFKSWLIFF